MNQLQQQYQAACNAYIAAFCKKQKIDFDYWIGDEVGGLASFAETYFFTMSDIVLDVDTKQRKGKILKWQDYNMEAEQQINYKSYTMGLRVRNIGVQ